MNGSRHWPRAVEASTSILPIRSAELGKARSATSAMETSLDSLTNALPVKMHIKQPMLNLPGC